MGEDNGFNSPIVSASICSSVSDGFSCGIPNRMTVRMGRATGLPARLSRRATPLHDATRGGLSFSLRLFFKTNPIAYVISETDFVINPESRFRPDLAVLR